MNDKMDNNKQVCNILDTYFFEFWDNNQLDINTQYEEIHINQFNACCLYIYNEYIRHNLINENNTSFNDKYTSEVYCNLVDWYINKCLLYNKNTIYGFILLLGINKQYLYSVARGDNKATPPVIEATKRLFEAYQETTIGKLNEDRIGLITQANNNKDIGLMYTRQQAIDVATSRQLVSLGDLPRLSDL